ncbi:MAG TPA: cell division protein ZapA [Burkholderiales bacterium]
MKETNEGVPVVIMGKEFRVACPEHQRESLIAAAAYLDRKLREVQSTGKVIGTERAAIMAALNISHELLELRQNGGLSENATQKVRLLRNKIDAALRWDGQTRQ